MGIMTLANLVFGQIHFGSVVRWNLKEGKSRTEVINIKKNDAVI